MYRFPSLQRTAASSQRSGRKEYVGRKWADGVGEIEFFRENKWQFRCSLFWLLNCQLIYSLTESIICNVSLSSKTSASERAMTIGLGGLNLFGVIFLGALLG